MINSIKREWEKATYRKTVEEQPEETDEEKDIINSVLLYHAVAGRKRCWYLDAVGS
jgi:hypothetical protein